VPLGVIQEVHRARAFARAKRKKGQACRQALHSIACAPSVRSRRQNKKTTKRNKQEKRSAHAAHQPLHQAAHAKPVHRPASESPKRKATKNKQTRKRKQTTPDLGQRSLCQPKRTLCQPMPAQPPPKASCGSPARTAMLFSTLPVVFGLRLTVQLKSRHASMHHTSHPPPKLSRQLPMPPS
jgi:hypothetical protein